MIKNNNESQAEIKKPYKIHDTFFKNSMADLTVAREFFLEYLPAHVSKDIDFSTLRQEKEEFLDRVLRPGQVDVLFSVKFKKDKDLYIWPLVEHQSTQDRFLPFRVLKYALRICEFYLNKDKNNKELPLVLPIVFYTGRDPYKKPLLLWDLFPEPALAKEFLGGPLRLIELRTIPDARLRSQHMLGFSSLVMKHIGDDNILFFLKRMNVEILKVSIENFPLIESAFWYILEKAESADEEKVIEAFRDSVSEDKRERIMTIAESLKKKGIELGLIQGLEKGKQEGLQEGLQKGRQEQTRLIAQKFLNQGIDIHLVSQATGLSEDELKNLSQDSKTPSL